MSSIGPSLASMTSRRQIQDGDPTTSDPRWQPHDVRSKMAAPTTSDPRWRPLLPIKNGGRNDVRSKMAAPMTSDPRWRPPQREIQDGGPTKSDARWWSL